MVAGSPKALSESLKQLVLARGAACVGIADLSAFFSVAERAHVSAIVFGMKYPDAEVELLPDDDPLIRATQGLAERTRAIYAEITAAIGAREPLARCCRVDGIVQTFGKMDPVLSQKAMGVLAGLGWIGKSSLLINPLIGPRMRLGTLLTDAPLVPDEPYPSNGCRACRICINTCPDRAVSGEEVRFGGLLGYRIDRQACGRRLGRLGPTASPKPFCGLCLKECPYGQS